MTTDKLIKGLQILQPYYDKPDGYNVGAEHDVLFAFMTPKALSDDDVNKMIELGWHQEHDEVDDEDEDFSLKDYRHDESWIFYT